MVTSRAGISRAGTSRAGTSRAAATRDRLLDAAERLVAEDGMAAATQRRIAEAAGQANNSAVGYHIGDRGQLVRAVIARHAEPMDQRRREMLEQARGSDELRDHVACVVRPLTEHLDALGIPSWYARFTAHVAADPGLREHLMWEGTSSEVMRDVLTALVAAYPAGVSATAIAIRAEMVLNAIVHTCAERERALATGTADPASWDEIGDALVDAITGMLLAPGGPARPPRE